MTEQENVQSSQPAETPLPSPHHRAWPTFLVGVLILLFGIAIGAGGARLLEGRKSRHWPRDRGKFPSHIASRLQADLGLTDAQTEKVKAIYAKQLDAMHEMRQDMLPKVKAHHEQLRTEIKEVLTVEQYAKWEEGFNALCRKMMGRSRGQRRHSKPPSPPEEP